VNSYRRSYIGASDAWSVIAEDESALVRLWQEKLGEVEPEDPSGELVVQPGTTNRRNEANWLPGRPK